VSAQIPDWYPFIQSAKALGVSPFELDERAYRTRHHPVWRWWAMTADACEPPKVVVVAGMI
jgi:hypothetical protein